MKIAALHRYPVKSMGGQALDRTTITPRGLAGDRRWMMVRPDGRFLTRRELPAMALVTATPLEAPDGRAGEGGLRLRHADLPDLAIAAPGDDAARMAVKVWGDAVEARAAGPEADAWLARAFGRDVRLVHMADCTVRPVSADYGRAGDAVSFADGFPLLVTTVESLAALNAALAAQGADPVTMARFRPNVVLEGAGTAFAEDHWQTLRIGALTLRVVKPCTRCVITTQDPATGASLGAEPLRTLKAMGRVWNRMPVFGHNAIPDGAGEVAVGDAVEVG